MFRLDIIRETNVDIILGTWIIPKWVRIVQNTKGNVEIFMITNYHIFSIRLPLCVEGRFILS